MEQIEAALAVIGLGIKTLIGGAVGSVVQLRFWAGLDWGNRLLTVAAGIGLAWLFTKPMLVWFKLNPVDYEIAVAGGIGIGGMAIIAGIWKTTKEIDWKGLVEKALRRKLGAEDKGE